MNERPNVDELLAPLKGFQKKTVEYVFRRMYEDPDPALRFLVADEVGLGKTLIARGIIARAVDHLWDRVNRLDVVYICSNVAIARQNLSKLAIGGAKNHALATRLTLLPQELKNLDANKLNFVSFTPSTSFDLKSRTGVVSERVVLYWLLATHLGEQPAGLRNLLQAWRGWDRWQEDIRKKPELDDSLVAGFVRKLEEEANAPLRERIDEALHAFRRWREDWPLEHCQLRDGLVGDLRALLARTCVDALEPDLIILDEFQRFRHLLHGDDEMSSLARSLWQYVTPEQMRARVLLLSATPYRMYSTDAEVGAEDHYRDFIDTTRFLMDGDTERLARFQEKLDGYRHAVHDAIHGTPDAVLAARDAVQDELRRVMVRTERIAFTADRSGMVDEPDHPAPIAPEDIEQWRFLDELSTALGERDAIELWKSAPYLPQFMREYKLKERMKKQLGSPALHDLVKRWRKRALLRPKPINTYAPLDPANARLRALMHDLLDGGQHELLWIAPTLPYWQLAAPFDRHRDFTKALVFSAWNVVPDAVSAILSYEAERRMLGEDNDGGYRTLHKKHRGLLQFSLSENRLTGMPVLALHYPSLVLADELCPLTLLAGGATDVRAEIRARVEALLARLPSAEAEGREDESWYWAAPALLDAAFGRGTELLDPAQWHLAHPKADDDHDALDTEGGAVDDSRFADHVERLRRVVRGDEPLGAKPADLADVVTELALGAPAVLAARSLRPVGATDLERQRAAAVVAEGLRTLFNQPTAMAVVRRLAPKDTPYWRATLHYAIAGCLQAVFDEHFHQLWEQLGWEKPDPTRAVHRIAEQMGYAASIKTSRVRFDDLRPQNGEVVLRPNNLRTSFALRYGTIRTDENTSIAREGAVRAAFNSPYRPFVLASTSIGQEGLDFHPWCHAIVHWNLPGNPVDLEQREGRVHRYEGHAVRKNVAAEFGLDTLRARFHAGDDPWALLFDAAAGARATRATSSLGGSTRAHTRSSAASR